MERVWITLIFRDSVLRKEVSMGKLYASTTARSGGNVDTNFGVNNYIEKYPTHFSGSMSNRSALSFWRCERMKIAECMTDGVVE